ncbi:MAG: deaminase [Candidatus Saccharimonadales bacterium]
MVIPERLSGYSFSPVNGRRQLDTPVTDMIEELMQESFEEAETALQVGNTPVGAVLLDMDSGQRWSAYSTDKVDRVLDKHAEQKAYRDASSVVQDQLGRCALVSTFELCTMCTTTYAQGAIGTIIVALQRKDLIREDGSPILRPRKINMPEILEDSGGTTNVYVDFRADESLTLWRKWDRRRQ